MPRILFVFLDGVGLGPPDPGTNPFARLALPAFERLAGGRPWTTATPVLDRDDHLFRALDANLGVDGLPQSGTGQATLFTGVNCARVAGRHFGPYPHSRTKPVLAEHNVFRRIEGLGLPHPHPSAFANAYPPRFFEMVKRRNRWTVTTLCCLEAGVPIRTLDDLREGRAVTADLTGEGWREMLGHDVPPLSEEAAGARLAELGRSHAFTLFEYFLTDKAGHKQSHAGAERTLHALDRFFSGLLDAFDPARELLLVTSDHGNLEDLAVKTHTRHAVPLVALGRGAERFRHARSIADVTPAVIEALRS